MSGEDTNVANVLKFYDQAASSPSGNSLARRRETRILHLRNFNNWVKSIFIGEYVERARQKFGREARLRVLDICCGKGGDQLKWAQSNVDHVTFVDLSSASVEACRQRYRDLRSKRHRLYTADFHVSDCTIDMTDGFLSGRIYELVSCQFSFHYALESWSQAHAFLSNVSCCLRPGGYFIASIPNAYEIVRRANEAFAAVGLSETGISFGNSVYSIHFPSTSFSVNPCTSADNSPEFDSQSQLQFPLFGAKYDFHLEGVVDCPEFLVYPPLLNRLAEEHSLVPITKPIPFAQFFWDALNCVRGQDDPMELLTRMKALESLSVSQLNDSSDLPTHYEHVKKMLQINGSCLAPRNVGTISKEHWDVVNLYSVVSFQKR